MIKTTCRKFTADPITLLAECTLTANGNTYVGSYHGDEDEGRKECKAAALTELKTVARKAGLFI